MIDDKKLISRLLGDGLIDQDQLKKGLEAANNRGTSLYDVVIYDELVPERNVVEIASDVLNVPCVHLSDRDLDRRTARLIPADVASTQRALPLEIVEDGDVQVLQLAMLDPIDVMAMDEVANHVEIDIQPVLVGPASLDKAIDELYGDDDDDESIFELTESIDDPPDAGSDPFALGDGDSQEAIELGDSDVEFDEAPFAADGDSDEAIELGDSDIELDEEHFAADGDSDNALSLDPPDESTGPESNDDSWAAMFDEVDEPEDTGAPSSGPRPLVSDDDAEEPAESDAPPSGPISREMRDRPPTGVLDVADIDDDDDDEVDDGHGPAFSQHPASFSDDDDSLSGTQIGSPGELGDWELDEALEKSGAARLRNEPDADDLNSSPGTQVGAPVDPDQWDLDDGVYDDDDHGDESESSDAPAIDLDNDQTQLGVATRGDIPGLELDDDDADDSDVTDSDPSSTDSGLPAGDESDAGDIDPAISGSEAFEAAPEDVDKADGTEDADEADDAELAADIDDDDDDGVVPKSIRSALNKAASKKSKDASKDGDSSGPSLPKPPKPSSLSSVSDADSDGEEDDDSSALGRIDIKKKRVKKKRFQGVVEKRSDRDRQNSNSGSDADGDDAPAVELPDDIDSQKVLRGLLELLVDEDIVSADGVQALIDDAS